MLINTEGIIIRLQCADISILGRITSGVKLINLSEGVTVASVAKVREKDEEKPAESTEQDVKQDTEPAEESEPAEETQEETKGELE